MASFFIGLTLIGMNKGLEKYTPNVIPVNLAQLPDGVQVESQNYEHAGKTYVLNALGSQEIPDGKYLYDPATSRIETQWVQGIGSDAAPAPQARLMATVINGILTQRLPWRLVMLGVFLVVAIELLETAVAPFERRPRSPYRACPSRETAAARPRQRRAAHSQA